MEEMVQATVMNGQGGIAEENEVEINSNGTLAVTQDGEIIEDAPQETEQAPATEQDITEVSPSTEDDSKQEDKQVQDEDDHSES